MDDVATVFDDISSLLAHGYGESDRVPLGQGYFESWDDTHPFPSAVGGPSASLRGEDGALDGDKNCAFIKGPGAEFPPESTKGELSAAPKSSD